MGYQPSGISFALIGHQDRWENISHFVNNLRRRNGQTLLSENQIRETYRYIPPRPLFDIDVYSTTGSIIRGIYIETFIPPEELNINHLQSNIQKVKEACVCAAGTGAKIVSLGGFTSIVLEKQNSPYSSAGDSFFTTGNSLTASFIVKGVEKACAFWNTSLKNAQVLIVGSTGDIGTACARYFFDKSQKLLLCARHFPTLMRQADFFSKKNIPNAFSTNINDLLPQADVIICVASSILESYKRSLVKKEAILCDAGYPKNLQHIGEGKDPDRRSFLGGLGEVKGGFKFGEGFPQSLYHFPFKHISYGCFLESVVLAMEEKYEAFSSGRGNITMEAMDTIYGMAKKHGIILSPLFNENGEIKNHASIKAVDNPFDN